jgi:hypothetical protein
MNMTRSAIALFSAVLVCATGTAGCADADDDDLDDEKAATTTAALDLGMNADEIDDLASIAPAQAALDLTTSKSSGCRVRTVDPVNPNIVHVVLTNCTGRFGKHVVNGNVTITFSANADGSLHAEHVSSNLTIDGRPFSRTASADIRVTGNVRYVSRHTEKTGTKKNGAPLVHTGDHVIVHDHATRCRTVNGTGLSIIDGDRRVESKITNFQTCDTATGEDLCPTGTIEHVKVAKEKTVTKIFDGSETATIEISKPKRDKTRLWTLDCTPR